MLILNKYKKVRLSSIFHIWNWRYLMNVKRYHAPANENSFFHSYMENNPNYAEFVKPHPKKVILDKRISILSHENKYNDLAEGNLNSWEDFIDLSYLNGKYKLDLENPKYFNPITLLLINVKELQYETLRNVLFGLNLWSTTNLEKGNYFNIWKELDNECCRRAEDFSLQKLLEISDLWYHLDMAKINKYNLRVIMSTLSNNTVSKLSNSQLIYTLFLINIKRAVIRNTLFLQIETELLQRMSTLTTEELAIAVMSFFKTKTRMKSDTLLQVIMETTIKNIDFIDPYSFASLVKHFRKSSDLYQFNTIEKLIDISTEKIKQCNPVVGMHLCFLADNLIVYNPTLLKHVAKSIIYNSDDLRIKEISQMARSLSFFGHIDKEYQDTVIRQFEREDRKEEILEYPSCLVISLKSLCSQNVYPKNLLNYVFSRSFLNSLKEKHGNTYGRDLSFIDCSIEIELPNYQGNRMNKTERLKYLVNSLLRIPEKQLKTLTFGERNTLEIASKLDEILQIKECCMITHITPHYANPDILLVKENDKFQPIPVEALNCPVGEILRPASKTWIAIVLIGRQMYYNKGKKVLGQAKTKIRQLEKLGYNVLQIPLYEYSNDIKYKSRSTYLRHKLKQL